ncbi:DivIVA domain-containing protein [Arthrobacter sp. Sr24]
MTYFLIFLAVMVAAAGAMYVVGLNKPQASPDVYEDVLGAPVANLPPVLLPRTPEPGDVDKLSFSLGLRGYRMDQVDEVLDRLRDELAAKNVRIAALESGNAAVSAGSKPAENASHGLEPAADAATGADTYDAGATPLATTPASAGLAAGDAHVRGQAAGTGSSSGSSSGSGLGSGDGIDGEQ